MRDIRDFRERNAYSDDILLRALLERGARDLARRNAGRLEGFGRWVTVEVDAAAAYTDREAPPRLVEAGEGGDPAARLVVNPRYAAIHREAYRHGMVGLNHGPTPEPFLLTFVMGYLLSQADISIHCPVTLTGAVALVLDRLAPEQLRARYLEPLTRMDGSAATGGTWATEREGGSDVGASTTVARYTTASRSPASSGFAATWGAIWRSPPRGRWVRRRAAPGWVSIWCRVSSATARPTAIGSED